MQKRVYANQAELDYFALCPRDCIEPVELLAVANSSENWSWNLKKLKGTGTAHKHAVAKLVLHPVPADKADEGNPTASVVSI